MQTILATAVTLGMLLLSGPAARAATVTWDGAAGGDATWTDPDSNSWTGATYNNGDDAQFLGAGSGTVTLSGTISPNSVTVDSADNYTFAGVPITGTGTLTKDGSGTLTPAGGSTSSYTGATAVNAGELILDGFGGSGAARWHNSATTVESGAILTFVRNDGAVNNTRQRSP